MPKIVRQSLRSIRKAYWRKLIWVGFSFLLIIVFVTFMFWRSIPDHIAFLVAIIGGFAMAFAIAVCGFIYFNEKLINPLIDLGRAARAQKLLGIPLDAEQYEGTMLAPLAQILAHHEEGELERANTPESTQWAHEIGDRALNDLNFVIFDCETTGLNPQGSDQILQIGAVRVRDGKVCSEQYFAQYVNPGFSIPRSSTRIHGIDDRRVADAPTAVDAVNAFHEWVGEDVLVAHNAAFDMAFLRKTGIKFQNYVLDTVFMSAYLFDHTGTHTLDVLTERLGVIIPEQVRHDAHGDALGTAEVFAHLIVLLNERGIVTLNDAVALGQKMRRIRRAQAIYG